MHNEYDKECSLGDDEPILLASIPNKEALGVTADVLRVHEVISRKGKSWNRGQKVKILKGACAGCHKNNIFVTLEYFLLEGFEKDAGGEARIVCRPLGFEAEDGSVLDAASSSLELNKSLSLPMIVIDSGKCIAVSDDEWNCQANKLNMKLPSMIEVLGPQLSKALDIDGALPTDAPVSAGSLSPKEIAAVLRPSNFSPSSNAADIDQKYIIRDNYEMCLEIKFHAEAGKSSKIDKIFSGTATKSSRKGCSGLYIFSVASIPSLFQKAGAYSFSFFLKNSSTSCEEIVRVKASAKLKRWELLKDDGNAPLIVSAGSSFPSLSVTRYDKYENIIPFKSTPEIKFQLLSNGVVLSHIKNVKVELSLNMDCMKLSNMRVATDKLDDIRPNYEATLALYHSDERPFLNVPCLVFPGPVKSVHVHPSETGKGLLPKQVVDDLRLELFHRHQNHVKEGTEVELDIYGFCFLDQIGLKRKVDNGGFLDLSGLLKVTEGYGKPVSLSVKYNKNVLCNKKFQVEERELRMATNVPELCHAGSKLKDIAFEVVNSEGHIDHAIHDDVKLGNQHTLRILSDVLDCESLSCAFRKGRCVIPCVTLPMQDGTFCFEAVHSQHPELRLKFEVNVSRPLHTEYDPASDLQTSEEEMTRLGSGLQDSEVNIPQYQNECSFISPLQTINMEQGISTVTPPSSIGKLMLASGNACAFTDSNECPFISPLQTVSMEQGISTPPSSIGKIMFTSGNVCALTESKLPKQQDTPAETPNKLSDPSNEHDLFKSPEGKITLLGSDFWDLDSEMESVEKEILDCRLHIKEKEDDLKWYALHRDEINEGLTQLQASTEVLPLPISQLDSHSPFQKEAVLQNIENKVDSPAAVYSIASQQMSLETQYPEFSGDVVGLVASLATAPTSFLSRSLAEYLGEDQMLGIVCKSSAAITMPEDYENVLGSLASKLGRTIRGSQLIICLNDIRVFDGDILETSCQRRLVLTKPALPNGTTPAGFRGYAVNMIDIDADYVQFRTLTGHGLRETLFYQLLGELQVYETKEDMKHALRCITTGAISLDGRIIRRKGMILLGSKLVDVHFPVVEPSGREKVAREIEEKKEELVLLEQAIECASEERQRCLKTFEEKKARVRKLLEEKEVTRKLFLSQLSLKTN